MFEIQETSLQARDRIKPKVETLRMQVENYLRAQGERGGTDEEIQTALNMSPNTERPRRKELEQENVIVDSGRKRKTQSGRNAIVWRINELQKQGLLFP